MADNVEEHDVDEIRESLLLGWRDDIDHELATLTELEARTRELANGGYSLDPEGVQAIADLLACVVPPLTKVRMQLQSLAKDAGELGAEELN